MSGKNIALKDYIEVDGHDLSDFGSAYQEHSDDEQVDVSGFNPTGADEFLQGKRTQSIDVTFFDSKASGEVHDVLYHLYRDRVTFTFKHRDDQNNPVSATNPQIEGNANILSYGPGATRGQARSFQVTFVAADSAGFVYSES
jgi:hypothetical protein